MKTISLFLLLVIAEATHAKDEPLAMEVFGDRVVIHGRARRLTELLTRFRKFPTYNSCWLEGRQLTIYTNGEGMPALMYSLKGISVAIIRGSEWLEQNTWEVIPEA